MELRTVKGRLKAGGAFKLIATGYLLGAGVIFVPTFALLTLTGLVNGAPATFNDQTVEGGPRIFMLLSMFIMAPLIVAMQSLLFGGLVVFGLWLYQMRRPITVIDADAVE